MRPAVYASVMRNRKTSSRRIPSTPHTFSWSRFFIMLFVGVVLFLPGITLTILGIEREKAKDAEENTTEQTTKVNTLTDNSDNSVLYRFIGPASLACGVGLILSSGIYYCCWGFQSPVSKSHYSKHKKHPQHAEQYDPLQTHAPPATITNSHDLTTGNHISSRNGTHASLPTSPDSIRSGRHNSTYPNCHHHPLHHSAARSLSKTSVDKMSLRSSASRHRSSSYTHRGNGGHGNGSHGNGSHGNGNGSHGNHTPSNHHERHHSHIDNQVAFVNTEAPLAQGESGSISIDIDLIGEKTKY